MLDFVNIDAILKKNGRYDIIPQFLIGESNDLMIRGGAFYAIWNETAGRWSTNEFEAVKIIDHEIDVFVSEHPEYQANSDRLYLRRATTGSIDKWNKFCKQQMPDNFHILDEKLIFDNDPVDKKDYSSKRLPYALADGPHVSWDTLLDTLYSPEEKYKIEWSIGSIVSGESKKLQKFMVLYGGPGTGKGTVIAIIQKLFDGYVATFDAKSLGSSGNSFALEPFTNNPLVAIDGDGKLSRIEDNTRLNLLVSHEPMMVNEKFKSMYTSSFKAFLIMASNEPVKITDAKSGLLRRLIDVSPTGNKIPAKEYKRLTHDVNYELGAIATYCRDLYLEDPEAFDDYIPLSMMGASNDFFNFVEDNYLTFAKEECITLKAAWEMYKTYVDDAKIAYPFNKRVFKEELKNYFDSFDDRYTTQDGLRIRSCYIGFKTEKFNIESNRNIEKIPVEKNDEFLIELDEQHSLLDDMLADYPAQYATSKDTPSNKWDNNETKLRDIDTKKVHYILFPEEHQNHIVIDFDLKNEEGKKDFELNRKAASKWPKTYAELSKGGQGIHLHYIYTGDTSKLANLYDKDIEIKVFKGKSALRRKLSKCNDIPVATISSNLPLKGEKVIDFNAIKTENGLRALIKKNLNKEIHPGTKPSIDFIKKILDDAYKEGLSYDVSDMYGAVLAFAANSTHQADYCLKMLGKMKFKSDDILEAEKTESNKPIAFYDIEVFPNLLLINWKREGINEPMIRMINPSPAEVEEFIEKNKLIGFNCRRYDNHVIYARAFQAYDNAAIFDLSQRIINNSPNCMFGQAYNLSYTDVYDFASAGNKMSLKKLEIKMSNEANDPNSKMDEYTRSLCKKIKHHELGLPWDQPVDEKLWIKVAEYCDDDVYATEAAFHYLSADWTARQILADLADMTVNDTTNTLTTRIIFGTNRKPQNEFQYRNLAEPVFELDEEVASFLMDKFPDMMGQTHGEAGSLLPYFPGYVFDHGKSTYRGIEVGEGGYAKGLPGIYGNVALLDITSMHPHSDMAECLFGPRYTQAYYDIVYGRVNIKHEAWDIVNSMLDGKLAPFVERVKRGEMTSADLANALKTSINSVYGLTAANFDNPFKDPRNIDNIVAKRGALFMIDLKYAVEERGFTVAHIKTDSIKIPDATPEIIEFVMEFGKRYGYSFEHECTYDRMCLLNDAVYIAKCKDAAECEAMYGYTPGDNKKKGGHWTATGTEFQVPYVFKTLFSHEEILFSDLCETKSVTSALYLDMNESLGEDKHDYHFVGKVGQFCPIKPGFGGGLLCREMKDKKTGEVKYAAATGSKGYRWLESEAVKNHRLGTDIIDMSYYENMARDAMGDIIVHGDFNWFVSDEPYIPPEFVNGHPVYNETEVIN